MPLYNVLTFFFLSYGIHFLNFCRSWVRSHWFWFILYVSWCHLVLWQRFARSRKRENLPFYSLASWSQHLYLIWLCVCVCVQLFWLIGVGLLLGWQSTWRLFTNINNLRVRTELVLVLISLVNFLLLFTNLLFFPRAQSVSSLESFLYLYAGQ